MTKDKIFTILTTLLVVVVGVVVANMLTTSREVDSTGKVVEGGKIYKSKLGFSKK